MHDRSGILAMFVIVGCSRPLSTSQQETSTTSTQTSGDGGEASGDSSEATAGTSEAEATTSETEQEDGSASELDDATANGESELESESEEADSGVLDTAPGCETPTCDLFLDDCGMEEKCMPIECPPGSGYLGSWACRPLLGAAEEGESCNHFGIGYGLGDDDCAAGFLCLDADPESGMGVCSAHCEDDYVTCPSEGTVCVNYNGGYLPICMTLCDPLAPACPNPDNVCIPSGPPGRFVCFNSLGDGPYGAPCESSNSCAQGLLCADSGHVPHPECGGAVAECCTTFCDLSLANTCPDASMGQICTPYLDPAPPGLEDLGFCGIIE